MRSRECGAVAVARDEGPSMGGGWGAEAAAAGAVCVKDSLRRMAFGLDIPDEGVENPGQLGRQGWHREQRALP